MYRPGLGHTHHCGYQSPFHMLQHILQANQGISFSLSGVRGLILDTDPITVLHGSQFIFSCLSLILLMGRDL